MSPRDEATERQVTAAHPRRSTWLSANAGSGKTRVLTDRVARLLLDGASPQNILCLTYTKAAASEMQNRLFGRLGAWAMAPDADLRANLETLGVEGSLDDALLAKARRLFAQAIETPGGLKIQTIHSFCASLLRRFPLEAGVSPQFMEAEDRATAQLRADVVEEMADGEDRPLVDALAAAYTGEDFDALTAEIAAQRSDFMPPATREEIFGAFDLPPEMEESRLVPHVLLGSEQSLFARVVPVLAEGSKTDRKAAGLLAPFAQRKPGYGDLPVLESVLLTGESAQTPFAAKIGKFPTRATATALGDDIDPLNDLMGRVEAARPTRLALAAAKRSAALHAFAGVFIERYAAAKQVRGWLDFDDLIVGAARLLTDPDVAQWVLWRLDGGIDHILVDEAQDTSPPQWRVIERLAEEFAAGEGATKPGERTLFVVGDQKQSIYSFQGADPLAFDRMRADFAKRLRPQGGLVTTELRHSFRSSGAILRAVDSVFAGEAAGGLGGQSDHVAFHDSLPGRVDLWPLAEPEEETDPPEWHDPVDRVSPGSATVRLAEAIAQHVAGLIDAGTPLPHPKDPPRPMRAGDVLILVQRRGLLFSEIIRACKRAGLPIAGADRLKLGAELAVKDLRAMLAFLATPEDDLSLAAVLRSPLLGWSEGDLYALAHDRADRFLWRALWKAEAEHPETLRVLKDLRDWSDFLRPYDLLERILTRHEARRRLLARLGDEAEDGIDELLTQALAYERTDIPSLTGFLGWLDADDVEVKRSADSAGGKLRVMTVHGAKGLEAPVVILPDTIRRPTPPRHETFRAEGGPRLWKTAAADMPAPLAAARQAQAEAEARERERLLYVAMTRAETWLILCGVAPKDGRIAGSWYEAAAEGLNRLETAPLETPFGDGRRLVHRPWPGRAEAEAEVVTDERPVLPPWIDLPATVPAEGPTPLSPSDLGGAKALPGEGLPEAEALARGTAIHLLLEHLPHHPRETWEAVAAQLLIGADADHADLLAQARLCLDTPGLAAIFAPETLAEVPVTATLDALGGAVVSGALDRLVVGPDEVIAVDFKTNAVVPARPEDTPEGLLRQMGAYGAALRLIYPGKSVRTAILWTAAAELMDLPDTLVMAALRRAQPY